MYLQYLMRVEAARIAAMDSSSVLPLALQKAADSFDREDSLLLKAQEQGFTDQLLQDLHWAKLESQLHFRNALDLRMLDQIEAAERRKQSFFSNSWNAITRILCQR